MISVEGFQTLTGITRDSGWGAAGFLDTVLVITLTFVIYLTKNIHFHLSKVFSEASLNEQLSHVGAVKHGLPCESVEWLLHGAGFC